VIALNGYRDNGIQVLQTSTGRVLQTVPLPAGFIGLAFDPTGHNLYVSGGNRDVVYRLAWSNGSATLADSIILEPRTPRQNGMRYPAGLAFSRDGRRLYVAENLTDSLAVIDVPSGRVVQRLGAGRYPYGVVVGPDDQVFVSAWGSFELRSWRPVGDRLESVRVIRVGRHPSAMLFNADGSRLFVASASTDRIAVVDPQSGIVLAEVVDTIPGSSGEGSTPNGLALSADGHRLYIAEADNNAVAIFDLAAATAGTATGSARDQLVGRIPVEWYPTAVLLQGETMVVANAKGHRTGPNAVDGPGPGRKASAAGYTAAQITGSVSLVPLAGLDLGASSRRVARANGWDAHVGQGAYPPFEHVIYVIKENRTYDQVLGDLPQGDGDTSLTYFPRAVSPNHHALAERFGLFDRFHVNAEVSADGHNWSTGAYTTDYVQKTVPLNYGGKGRSYDYEGTNRGSRPAEGEDAAEPANGYLWDLAKRRGITFRNFGEFVLSQRGDDRELPPWYVGLKPFLESHTDSAFPGFDTSIPDQVRMDVWLAALQRYQRSGQMPALQIVRLPNDHTSGARVGAPSPRAQMADNDLALGRMIAGLSRSPFWKNTVVFVLEDDAQNGPDHVDSHRSPLLVISPYNTTHTWHRFANTTDVLATIEEILTLDHLSQFDAFGRPLRGIFTTKPDLTPYDALVPETPLTEKNVAGTPGARESAGIDLRVEDLVDDDLFNRILWQAIKGTERPYPGPRAATGPVLR
jgi:YVTN family beta-propeller protein